MQFLQTLWKQRLFYALPLGHFCGTLTPTMPSFTQEILTAIAEKMLDSKVMF